jgi:ferrous iron transport protein B
MDTPKRDSVTPQALAILAAAQRWRQQIPGDLHEHIVEALYGQAARLTERAVPRPGHAARPTFDRTLDRILTSRVWGFRS